MSDTQRMVEDLSTRSPLKMDKNDESEEGILDMSDQDLYLKLKEYDSNIGPVTRSTRKVYARKLKRYMENSDFPTSTSPVIDLVNDSDNEQANGHANGGSGDFTQTVIKSKTSKVITETRSKSKKSPTKYFVRGDPNREDEDDDGGWVESDDEEEFRNDTKRAPPSLFRTYPTSFYSTLPSKNTASDREDEITALIKSANDTFSASQRSANNTLNSSFKFDYSDDSGEDVISYIPQSHTQPEREADTQRKYKKSTRTRPAVKKVEGGWCGCWLKLLTMVLMLVVVLVSVVVYKSVDKDYKLVVKPEEWMSWGEKSMGAGVKWVKSGELVEWMKKVMNEWVVWVKDFEVMG